MARVFLPQDFTWIAKRACAKLPVLNVDERSDVTATWQIDLLFDPENYGATTRAIQVLADAVRNQVLVGATSYVPLGVPQKAIGVSMVAQGCTVRVIRAFHPAFGEMKARFDVAGI